MERTVSFYAQFGFVLVRQDSDLYTVLNNGAVEIHFYPISPAFPFQPTAGVFLHTTNLEQIHSRCASEQLSGLGSIYTPSPDGLAFTLPDPDGNLLQFAKRL